jgi:hypothetical protein
MNPISVNSTCPCRLIIRFCDTSPQMDSSQPSWGPWALSLQYMRSATNILKQLLKFFLSHNIACICRLKPSFPSFEREDWFLWRLHHLNIQHQTAAIKLWKLYANQLHEIAISCFWKKSLVLVMVASSQHSALNSGHQAVKVVVLISRMKSSGLASERGVWFLWWWFISTASIRKRPSSCGGCCANSPHNIVISGLWKRILMLVMVVHLNNYDQTVTI